VRKAENCYHFFRGVDDYILWLSFAQQKSLRVRDARWYRYLHTKKSKFVYIMEGLGVETFGTFCDNLDNLMASRFILWLFGIFVVIWCVFSRFSMFLPTKIWQPCSGWIPAPDYDIFRALWSVSRMSALFSLARIQNLHCLGQSLSIAFRFRGQFYECVFVNTFCDNFSVKIIDKF
jgi:hypothetical protein